MTKCRIFFLLLALGSFLTTCKGEDTKDQKAKYIPANFARIKSDSESSAPFIQSQTSLDDLRSRIERTKNKDIPPVPSDGGPLAVGVGVNIIKLKGLDEMRGTFEVTIDLKLCWTDERLSFNSGHGLEKTWQQARDKLSVSSSLLWTPDIVVLNEVGSHRSFQTDNSPLVLADDNFLREFGVNVLWNRRLDVKSRCDLDLTAFPFDVQKCSLIIGSWASSQRQMTLVPQDLGQEVELASGSHTQEFRVLNVGVAKAVVYSQESAQSFEEIRYAMSLERYPHFYVVNYILPMVAVTMLTIGSMWMRDPAVRMNSGTKMLLCVVNIMTITAKWRPAGHGDIWLDRFQSHCLALSMAAVLQSLVMHYLQRHESQWNRFGYRTSVTDLLLRTFICVSAIGVFAVDMLTVKRTQEQQIFTGFDNHSQHLLVGFLYIVFIALGISSACSVFWLALPSSMAKRMLEISQTCGGLSMFHSKGLPSHSVPANQKDDLIPIAMP